MSEMFLSYAPIRDTEYFYEMLNKIKEGKTDRPMKAINTYCRCVCPDRDKKVSAVMCHNQDCIFGELKKHLSIKHNLPENKWIGKEDTVHLTNIVTKEYRKYTLKGFVEFINKDYGEVTEESIIKKYGQGINLQIEELAKVFADYENWTIEIEKGN